MPDQGQAKFSYPGINSVEEIDFTDVAGTSPSTGVLTCYPQFGLPAMEGDLVLTQEGRTVTFAKCRIDSASYQRNSGGQVVSVKLMDERWRWQKGYVIHGKYNTRLPNNSVDPLREKTPRELVDLLCEVMDVTNIVADLVSSDPNVSAARPEVDWDVSNPAQELQSLLDSFGLRLVPRRSDGKFVICRTGEGATLTAAGRPYQDPSEGIDPNDTPDRIAMFGEPIRYQVRLELEAVGKDIVDPANQPSAVPDPPIPPLPTDNADGSWKPILQLTYTPKDATGTPSWDQEEDDMQNVSEIRIAQPDGSLHSPHDMAMQTVFRCYRVKETSGFVEIPGYTDPVTDTNQVTRKQLILTDELAEEYIDPDGQKRMKPAFCDFVGIHKGWVGDSNSTGGTRLDVQSKDPFDINQSETVGFSIDAATQIVTFSSPIKRYEDEANDDAYLPARVWLTCAVNVRDSVTWQPIRYTKEKPVPGAPSGDSKFVWPIQQDDLKQYYRTSYTIDPVTGVGTIGATTDNTKEVDTQADYYLDSNIASLQIPNSKTLTLIGIWDVDMDGAINQISYKISKSGADTVVSRGTEHDYRVPTYKDQMQRNARNELATAKQRAERKSVRRKLGN